MPAKTRISEGYGPEVLGIARRSLVPGLQLTARMMVARWSLALALVVACGCGGGSADPDGGGQGDGGSKDDAAIPSCNADEPFAWPVDTGSIAITASPLWKNQISTDSDPFTSPDFYQSVRWIKFAVLMRDPSVVYFQDSSTLAFHYEFASAHLDPFVGLSRAQFDQLSLHEEGQEVILGAVLFPPSGDLSEYAIQLVREEPYHPEMARQVIELVAANVAAPAGTTVLYLPTFAQSESANLCRDWFAGYDIVVDSADRWAHANSCYAPGWALGRLVYVAGADIEAAYSAGTLTPADILLTDSVPAEVPFVAGILTQGASTPNSHVAILARAYGIPFAHLALGADSDRAVALVGEEIVFRADADWEGCAVRLVDVDDDLPASDRAAILALKAPPDLAITPMATYGQLSRSTSGLTSADVKYFGGKAAGFGLLRAAIPDNSPDAIAFSFDLWRDFMAQSLPSGKTLAEEIALRLGGFTYPPDMAAVDAALGEVRALITGGAVFTGTQREAIAAALTGFASARKLRFRSSTNVEDTAEFVGAGLYDSYSGCLADDQDGDELGPSLCDGSKASERGVYRAIGKVFASFYNDNAFLERLRYGVNESQVGMALLVHYSFPDEDELANGVATGSHTQYSTTFDLVTQLGPVSVANPASGAVPEEVSVYVSSAAYPTFESQSSLVPLGGRVLDWPDEYEELALLLDDVDELFAQRNSALTNYVLDYEYKKVAPGELLVKQVRRLPGLDPDARWPVYLVNESTRLCVFQGEYGDAFSNHRMKSIWNVTTANQWLDAGTLSTSFYANIDLDYLAGAGVATISGDPASWPAASHSYDGERVFDSFAIGSGAERRDFTVEVSVDTEVRLNFSPLRTLRDHYIYTRVDYATAVPTMDWTGVTTTTSETVRLGPCPHDNVVTAVNRRVEEVISAGEVTVTSAYYWPEPPTGVVAGYTAPLYKWDQTTITGLTSMPIVLTGYYSQSYRPGHHNFGSDYIFDPWLEEDIAPAVLAELESMNIRLLYVLSSTEIWTLSRDGVLTQIE